MAQRGLLIVLSGPSGAGKGAIRSMLQQVRPEIRYGVSVTTRPKRAGELDGVNYHFVAREDFERLVANGEFIEWAEVYGHLYGTPRQPMEGWLDAGHDTIVEKDIQGALALKERYPDAVYVFILPPSLEELRNRIVLRGTESSEARQQRLASASDELGYVDRYDYAIVNDDLAEAARRLEAIIVAEKCRVRRQHCAVPRYAEGRGHGGG